MVHTNIQRIDIVNENISITFEKNWFQEDINTLSQLLLKKIKNHNVKEIILGADKESYRFIWLGAEFVLNFDYYSQSCWFSAQDKISALKIKLLFDTLVTNE